MADIDTLAAKINKELKDPEAIVQGRDLRHITWQRVPTGSLGFDLMLGGGWPLNSLNEILGQPSSGKTTMATKTIAANQAADPNYHCVWVAAEEFDYDWAQKLGLDLDRVTFVTTNQMETVYDICLEILHERATDAIVIDSLPHLIPADEWDKAMMDLSVGRSAYYTNKFLRMTSRFGRRSLLDEDRPCLLLIINQWRDKITQYGDPKTAPGGRGREFAAVTRVEVSRIEWLKHGDRRVGQTIKGKTIKNKTAPPMREHEVDYYFEEAMGHMPGTYDSVREAFTIATSYGVVDLRGSWYHFDGEKWQGKEKLWAAMRDDQGLVDGIDAAVRQFILHQNPPKLTPVKTESA